MILFSAKKTAVHDMHMDALDDYARASGLADPPRITGIGAGWQLLRLKDKVIFSQSTGVASLLVLPLARLMGKSVVHYMHEPTSLSFKFQDNPAVKSVIWQIVQWVEMRTASRVLVSRQLLLDQAATIYGVSPDKLCLAPLLMPSPQAPSGGTRQRITYLGRIDERRFFREFLQKAADLKALGFQPTVLTGDMDNVRRFSGEMSSDVDLFAEPNFSEELKARILGETHVLWNPKRGEIAQSGVTADAVRYGLPILLTDKDPSYGDLLEHGIAIDFPAALEENFATLPQVDPAAVAAAAAGVFSRKHGLAAFQQSYLPVLNADNGGTARA